MTSSLVGSEMCIRDSKRTVQKDPVLVRQDRPRLRAIQQAGNNESFDPVSYTHLTLPTICSV
eukprot:4162367-Prorocentrum_lima.AAC.1